MTCCRPLLLPGRDCPHGHRVTKTSVPNDPQGRTWHYDLSPACCVLCPPGKVLQSYVEHDDEGKAT